MRKIIRNFLSLAMALSMVATLLPAMAFPAAAAWNGTDVDTTWYTGDSPFTVSDAADLAGLAQLVNGGTDFSGKTILLGADIALNDTTSWAQWSGDTAGLNSWTPIGNYVDSGDNNPFSGTFSGQNHTISGIYISSASDHQGLFGYCDGGSISNLSVTQSYVEGANYVGAIAGYTINTALDSCSNGGTVKGTTLIGGIAGLNGGAASNCSNSGSVTGGYGVGGIAGVCGGTGVLTNCTNTGAIAAPEEYEIMGNLGGIGGIAGTTNADITGCGNSGTVTTTGTSSGGIAGYAEGGSVTSCYFTGELNGGVKSGGIIGDANGVTVTGSYSTGELTVGGYSGGITGFGEDVTVTNCYCAGTISSQSGENVGGIAGKIFSTSDISECYSSADISGVSYIGGIAGDLSGGSTVSACYSTGDISCSVQGAGGIAGFMFGGTVSNCYATGYVSGPAWLGGIAGFISAGSGLPNTTTACMALNSGITLTGTTISVSRVAYAATQSYAWEGMPILRGSVSYTPTSNIDGEHGLSVTAAQLKADTYWSTAGFTSANGWTYAAGGLPTLTDAGGMQVSALPLHVEPFPSSAGAGTSASPYIITEAAQLAAVADFVNSDTGTYASAYYKLDNDIDLGRIPCWEVIGIGINGGTGDHPFTGSFDGCGYEIRNLTISGLTDMAQGLFGCIGSGGIVKNIALTNCDVSCATWEPYIGAVAGYVADGAVIGGCSVTGNISGHDSVGGIAGAVWGTVRSCGTAGSIVSIGSDSSFGGIAGYVGSTGLVEKCTSSATVSGNGTGSSNYGGIAGGVSGTIQNCYSTGDVSGTENAGGIAGSADSGSCLKNCYATGGVSAASYAGNIAGYVYVDEFDSSYDAEVTNCYYLSGAAPGSDEATVRTAAELATAEMAWVLNTTDGTETNGGIWAQGATPLFADLTHKAVYKLTLDANANPAAIYTNADGSVTLPSAPAGTNGMAFLGWYEDSGYSAAYTPPSALTADDTVYGNFGTRILSLANDVLTHVYNGAAVSFSGTLTDNASGVTGASPVVYTYYTDQTGTLTTAANSGAASNGAAPKNVGTYYVKATAAGNTFADAAESGYASMSVSRAGPVITVYTDHPSGQKYGQDVTVYVTVAPPSGAPLDGFPSAGEISLAYAGATLVTGLAEDATPGRYTAVYTMPDTYSSGQQAVFTATIPSVTENYSAYTANDKTASVALLNKNATVSAVSASDISVTYGQSATFMAGVSCDDLSALTGTIQFTLDGANFGDAVAVSGGPVSITLDKSSLPYKSGAYVIGAVFAVDGTLSGEYENSSGSVNVMVSKKALTVKPKDVTITVGAALPVPELEYGGFVSGESETVLTVSTPFAMEIQNADGSVLAGSTVPGTYSIVITAGAATADNYAVDTADGTLTIQSVGGGLSGTVYGTTVSTSGGITTASTTITAATGAGGIASGEVTDGQFGDAIEKAEAGAKDKGTKPELEIGVDAGDDASGVFLTISQSSFASLADSSVGRLTVTTPIGTVSFDSGAISAIDREAAGDVVISIEEADTSNLSDSDKEKIGERPVYDLTVTSGSATISDFGGGTATVSLPYTPAYGEDPDNIVIYYISDSGELVMVPNCVYDANTGMVKFAANHFSVYAVGYNEVSFEDVSGWYKDFVDFVAARGIMNGSGDKMFDPGGTMTRGMLVTVLYRLSGDDGSYMNNFADVPSGAWYENAAAWARENGIVSGIGNGLFAPENDVTREQLAAMLHNYAKYRGYDVSVGEDTNILSYNDAIDISDYAYPALQWGCGAGILNGDDRGNLNPQDFASRAEAAAVLYRFLKLV